EAVAHYRIPRKLKVLTCIAFNAVTSVIMDYIFFKIYTFRSFPKKFGHHTTPIISFDKAVLDSNVFGFAYQNTVAGISDNFRPIDGHVITGGQCQSTPKGRGG